MFATLRSAIKYMSLDPRFHKASARRWRSVVDAVEKTTTVFWQTSSLTPYSKIQGSKYRKMRGGKVYPIAGSHHSYSTPYQCMFMYTRLDFGSQQQGVEDEKWVTQGRCWRLMTESSCIARLKIAQYKIPVWFIHY